MLVYRKWRRLDGFKIFCWKSFSIFIKVPPNYFKPKKGKKILCNSLIGGITPLVAVFLLGVAGNAIPIARAGIADLKIHDFRTAMGWSTTFIGFGWVSAVILSLIFPPFGVLTTAILLQIIAVVFVKYFFVDIEDAQIETAKKIGSVKASLSSFQWTVSMFFVSGGAAALLAYLFTETAFYQIYSLNEEGIVTLSAKVIGLSMAFGYAFGVIVQWILPFSDRSGIKIGIAISLISLLLLVLCKWVFDRGAIFPAENTAVVRGMLDFFFAFGFGFSVPSLFSLMSTKIDARHTGRLFGAIDTVDTLALGLSSFALYFEDKYRFNGWIIYVLLLLFFIFSFLFYRIFIKRFTSYEK